MFKWIFDLKPVDSPTEVYGKEDRQAMADWMRDRSLNFQKCWSPARTPANLTWN